MSVGKLSDVAVRKAVKGEKDRKLADGGGLYLLVTKTGFKSWRLKYRFGAKEKLLVIGPYPEIGLSEARDLRDAARRQLRDNIDPGVEKVRRKVVAAAAAGLTFEVEARAWHRAQAARWSKNYADLVMRALERDIFPEIGRLPMTAIDAPLVVATLRKIEARGALETAKRIRQHIEAVFAFAIAEGVATTNPAAGIGLALQRIVIKGKQPALTTLAEVRQLVDDVDSSSSHVLTKIASRLVALTAVRPGVVQGARWAEFEGIDWEQPDAVPNAAIWRVPAARMKQDLERKADQAFEHIVPLARQTVESLHIARRFSGHLQLLFPHAHSACRPMSNNTLGVLYNRLEYRGRHVPHGWRAAFSTIMNERARKAGRDGDRAVLDMMLAHVPKGLSGSEAAYNRSQHMERRTELAQEWADLLLEKAAPASSLITA